MKGNDIMYDEKVLYTLGHIIDSMELQIDILFNISEDGHIKDFVFLDNKMREMSITDVLIMIDNEMELSDYEMLDEFLFFNEFMKKIKSYEYCRKNEAFFEKRLAHYISDFNEEMQKQVLEII